MSHRQVARLTTTGVVVFNRSIEQWPFHSAPRLKPRNDQQDRIWRVGARWRRLGIQLGTTRRRRFAGDHASCAQTRRELDRYGRSIRPRSFRRDGRLAAARTVAIRSPDGVHQMWIDMGSERSDGPAATRTQVRGDSAGMRRFVAAAGSASTSTNFIGPKKPARL